ncbi:MAG: hypothetical protein PHY44_09205 [Lachnospiraceae bacterium]|nr:hypothetical protein [Lachnospiraceae bacterium]
MKKFGKHVAVGVFSAALALSSVLVFGAEAGHKHVDIKYSRGKSICVQKDTVNHTKITRYEKGICSCGETIANGYTTHYEEPHKFSQIVDIDGVSYQKCSDCGYLSYSDLYEADVVYKPINETLHSVTAKKYLTSDKSKKKVIAETQREEYHDFNAKGLCKRCGYRKTDAIGTGLIVSPYADTGKYVTYNKTDYKIAVPGNYLNNSNITEGGWTTVDTLTGNLSSTISYKNCFTYSKPNEIGKEAALAEWFAALFAKTSNSSLAEGITVYFQTNGENKRAIIMINKPIIPYTSVLYDGKSVNERGAFTSEQVSFALKNGFGLPVKDKVNYGLLIGYSTKHNQSSPCTYLTYTGTDFNAYPLIYAEDKFYAFEGDNKNMPVYNMNGYFGAKEWTTIPVGDSAKLVSKLNQMGIYIKNK